MNQEEQSSPVENLAPEDRTSRQETPTPTTEDRPVETQPVVSETAPAAPVVKRESWFRRFMRALLFAIIFLLLGAAGVFFTLTNGALTQVSNMKLAASSSADQIATLQSDLSAAQSELAAATATVEAQNAQAASLNLANAIYKMQADVNTIRVALLKLDPITASQALGNASKDVATLASLGVDQSTLDGFTTRLNNASRTLSTDPQKSMIELDNLIDNLYLLATNLK